jgi:hypothetical protein
MKTIAIKIYKFSELSEEAKQKAIEKLYDINVDYNWWDSTYDDAENVGLKITSFDLDNKGVTGEFIGSAIETAQKILNEHGDTCETNKTAGKYFKSLHEGTDDEISDSEQEFLNDILEDYRIILRNEYEYLTSKEAIIETIEANDYGFTEDGKQYTGQMIVASEAITDDPKIRSFAESLADISQLAGQFGFYSGNSREDIDLFIDWAEEFEVKHKDTDWAEIEYMDEIEKFAMEKIEKHNTEDAKKEHQIKRNATDLFSTLKEALRVMDDDQTTGFDDGIYEEETTPLIERMKLAIAKAEGRAE